MRKLLVIAFALCLVASVAAAQGKAPAKAAASSEMKINTTWKCAKASVSHALPAGDMPNHTYSIQQVKCTATAGEIGGVKQTEGNSTEFNEATGNKVTGHGVFVENLGADKIVYTFESTGNSANNRMTTGTNKWTVTSGTGKMKGIKGSGTCTGKGNPDGSATFNCTGTYTMGK